MSDIYIKIYNMGQAKKETKKKSSRKNILKRDRIIKNNTAILKKLKN